MSVGLSVGLSVGFFQNFYFYFFLFQQFCFKTFILFIFKHNFKGIECDCSLVNVNVNACANLPSNSQANSRSRSLSMVAIFLMNWLRLFAFSVVFNEFIWINEMRSVKVSAHLD